MSSRSTRARSESGTWKSGGNSVNEADRRGDVSRRRRAGTTPSTRFKRRQGWEEAPAEELLSWRLCDLGVSSSSPYVAPRVERLYEELDRRGVRVRPHTWLSEEWFCPEGVPGIAIPFFLAHPRLLRLERQQMLIAEGGTERECMRLLRHEMGHVMQQAYRLHRRRAWRQLFGRSTEPYPDYYRPRPRSRDHVRHLGAWYAQAHPMEDFAETFAVWLTPRSAWRKHYEGWPALRKLEYVDNLMSEINLRKPLVTCQEKTDSIRQDRRTLSEYYEAKKEHYGVGFSDSCDDELYRLFDPIDEATRRTESAVAFLKKHRSQLREQVGRWVGDDTYAVDHVFKQIMGRCRELRLQVRGSSRKLRRDCALMLMVHTLRCLSRGEWHAM